MSTSTLPATQRRLTSTITASGQLRLQLETVPVPTPADHEVLIRVEAAPINPSDLFLLTGPADLATLRSEGDSKNPVAVMDVPAHLLKTLAARLDKPMPVGNEGSGVVVAAGKKAQALLGKLVGVAAGDMFCQYRCAPATHCIVMNEGTTAQQAASCFVNPLTSLSMVETMRMENHKALVHTAAASNLGQMLVKICQADGIPLVNIVRNDAQVAILKGIGAEHVVDSSKETFLDDLAAAIGATKATMAFDAIGGGKLVSQIMTVMEQVANSGAAYSRYGSNSPKHAFIYGALDLSPTVLTRNFGFSWDVSGWLLTPWMGKLGAEVVEKMRRRVMAELTTTFASHYKARVTLDEALTKAAALEYNARRTGEKYLITP